MYAFDYHRPSSVADAVAALKGADDGTFVAGGMTLIPTLKQRLASPSDLVDLAALSDLKKLFVDRGGSVVVGALCTHAEVAASDAVRSSIPALADVAGGIGDAQVRNRGTIGGSIANNDPAADYPAALLALDATVHTDRRTIAAGDFFTGLFETALQDGELITEIRIPVPAKAAYAKFANPASRYAIVGVMVAQTDDGVRVAVTGAGADGVFRATDIEQALAGGLSTAAIDGVAVSADGLNGDIHAAADYRAHLIKVMAKRAVAAIA